MSSTARRARKREFVDRVPQSALDEIAVIMQEQREAIAALREENAKLRAVISDEIDTLRVWLSHVHHPDLDFGQGFAISLDKLQHALRLAKGRE